MEMFAYAVIIFAFGVIAFSFGYTIFSDKPRKAWNQAFFVFERNLRSRTYLYMSNADKSVVFWIFLKKELNFSKIQPKSYKKVLQYSKKIR